MNKDYLTHWVLGFVCTAIWFWGDKAGIPAAAIQLASTIVPTLIGHSIAFTPSQATQPAQVSLSPVSSEQPK